MRCSSMSCSVSSGDHPSIRTTPEPAASGAVSEMVNGAAWYSGPVHRLRSFSPAAVPIFEYTR